jgi:hypothetical protein
MKLLIMQPSATSSLLGSYIPLKGEETLPYHTYTAFISSQPPEQSKHAFKICNIMTAGLSAMM